MLDAIARLLTLLDAPEDIPALAPLVLREITYRILAGPHGAKLRQFAAAGAPAHRIARAVQWLTDHYAEPLRVDELAKRVGMSPSALHLHFKHVTTSEPAPVSEAAEAPGGAADHARRGAGRGRGGVPGRRREPVPVRPGVPPNVRHPAGKRRGCPAARSSANVIFTHGPSRRIWRPALLWSRNSNLHLIDSPSGLSPATVRPFRAEERASVSSDRPKRRKNTSHLYGIRRTQHFPHHMPAIGRHVSPAAATYL